jgi:hypothetical protein
MKAFPIEGLRLVFIGAVLAFAPLSHSQPATKAPQSGPASEASPMFQRHHAMAGIMKDMIDEMSRMQAQMDKGDLIPETRKQMASKMTRMSDMMRRMSGLTDRPTMNEPEARKQYEEMRKQMDDMMKSAPMGNMGKPK